MDRKTLEAVEQLIQHRYNQAYQSHVNSPHRETREAAWHMMSVCNSLSASIAVLMPSEAAAPVEPAKVDDSLSYHDVRRKLDEARAELARIARLAQEANR